MLSLFTNDYTCYLPITFPLLPFSSKQGEKTNILNVFNTLVTPQNILKVSNLWTDYGTKVELGLPS